MERIYKLYIGLAALCVSLSLGACSDFLTQTPTTQSVEKTFFKNQDQFQQAVNGMYPPLRPLYDNPSEWGLQSLHSDNLTFVFNPNERGATEIEDLDNFTIKSTNAPVTNNWNRSYAVIARANQVLASLKNTNVDLDPSFVKKAKGQALFLRALVYFQLVRNYENIVMPLKPATDYNSTFSKQVPADTVYKHIISDATEAAKLLPDRDDDGPGRASAAAAYTLLGTVYLTLHQPGKAEDAIKPVLNMSEYGLLSNYADIFKPKNEGNKEMIFAVQFHTGFSANPQYSTFPGQFIPYLADISVLTGINTHDSNCCGGYLPTPSLIKAFGGRNTNDKRLDASIGFYTGSSPIQGIKYNPQPYVKKYLHPHSTFNQFNQNWPVYRYAQDLLMMARAVNEQGGRLSVAKGYLDQVRRRAGLNNSTASNQQELGKAILKAFRLEFAFENKRWYSLLRTGNAIKVMTKQGQLVKANPVGNHYPPSITQTSYLNGTYNITKQKLIFPIPHAVLNTNPDLKENPGYDR
jgi:hypothetical protein